MHTALKSYPLAKVFAVFKVATDRAQRDEVLLYEPIRKNALKFEGMFFIASLYAFYKVATFDS